MMGREVVVYGLFLFWASHSCRLLICEESGAVISACSGMRFMRGLSRLVVSSSLFSCLAESDEMGRASSPSA